MTESPHPLTVSWRMAPALRGLIMLTGLAVFLLGLYVTFGGSPSNPVRIGLGAALWVGGANLALGAWRAALTLFPNAVVVQYGFQAKRVLREEIVGVKVTSSGVAIRYDRKGKTHSLSSAATMGALNPAAGSLSKKRIRPEEIADAVTHWWRTGEAG